MWPAGRPSPVMLQSEGRAESTSSTSSGRDASSVPEGKQPIQSKEKKRKKHPPINIFEQ